MNKNSTRFYSSQQEKKVSKNINGKLQANSGATLFSKGDIISKDWLFECKTCMKLQNSFSIKQEWLYKLKDEQFAMNKDFSALVFNFGNMNENYYILTEKDFVQILHLLKEKE